MTQPTTPQDALREDAIDAARGQLLAIQNQHFKDKSFDNYIRHDMAGDFAFEIARAFELVETAQQPAPDHSEKARAMVSPAGGEEQMARAMCLAAGEQTSEFWQNNLEDARKLISALAVFQGAAVQGEV